MALTASVFLLVFSLVLIAIGLVATSRLRRLNRAVASTAPAAKPASRGQAAPAPAPKAAAPGRVINEPWAARSADLGAEPDEYWVGQSAQAYPGGMDAEAAEIERLRAEVAALKASGGVEPSGFKRTQALVAVGANISGILGLLVSVAALLK
jgi:hypothetical protein